MNYQDWKWIGDKEVATYPNGAVVITDDGGEVNFKSAHEACLQLKEMIEWLESNIGESGNWVEGHKKRFDRETLMVSAKTLLESWETGKRD